jgi:hypothetical protein
MLRFKIFFVKILLFLGIIIFVDLLIGQIFSFLLEKQKDGRFYKIQYSLKYTNDDIIIIGSSRAEFNYNPAVFSELLGMSCWNAGRGGQGLVYFLAIEQEILKRFAPKVIIMNIDPRFLEGQLDYDKSSILRPFAKEYPDIFNLLSQKEFNERFKLNSNLYAYNSVMFYFIRPFFVKNKDGKTSDKGWKPRTGVISNSLAAKKNVPNSNQVGNLNQEKINILNKMIDMANKNNCMIVFSISPDYLQREFETATILHIKELSKDLNIRITDFSQDTSLVGKQKYFFDLEHLNANGASKFSESVAEIILKDLAKWKTIVLFQP